MRPLIRQDQKMQGGGPTFVLASVLTAWRPQAPSFLQSKKWAYQPKRSAGHGTKPTLFIQCL
jgi:hypothetical protein